MVGLRGVAVLLAVAAPLGAGGPVLCGFAGSDLRISQDSPGRPHPGPSVASDPLDPLHFVAVADDYSIAPLPSLTGIWVSRDGGMTWAGGSYFERYPGGPLISPGGAASVSLDALGNTFVADLGSGPGCDGGVYAHRSTDGGVTFAPAVPVAVNALPFVYERPRIAADAEVAGAHAGWVYLVFERRTVSACGAAPDEVAAMISVSSDHGQTWSSPALLRQPLTPAPDARAPDAAVAGDGALYVAYNHGHGLSPPAPRLYVLRSNDGGQNFSGPFPVTPALSAVGFRDADGTLFVQADGSGHGLDIGLQAPVLAVTPWPEDVYVAWTHHDPAWDTTYSAPCCHGSAGVVSFAAGDIAFARSSDGGFTWSPPLRVNDDPPRGGKDQFLPAMTVAPDGVIHLSWYDRRGDALNLAYDVAYAVSRDRGASFSGNARLSDVASDPAQVLTFNNASAWLGSRSGIAASSARVLPLWCDMRAGTPAGEQRVYTFLGLPVPALAAVAGLAAVKLGGDVALSWTRDPVAAAYNLWTVDDKAEIDQARQSSPPATGVPQCSFPFPTGAPSCLHRGALAPPPALLFYQVRDACDASSEGP